jgi:HEAT repeats
MGTLEIILSVIVVQCIALAFLLVATVVTQTRKSGGKIQRWRSLWEHQFPEALAGDSDALAAIRSSLGSRSSFEAFHAFLDDRLRRERGRSTLGLRRLSRVVGFTDWLHEQLLGARDPLDRAAAAKTLGRLRERMAQRQALALLRSNDPAVVLAAAYATASSRDPKLFLPVFRAVYDRTPITLHGAAELLSGFEDGICPEAHRLLIGVAGRYQHNPGDLPADPFDRDTEIGPDESAAQVVMIDLLAFYGYRPAAPTILRLLDLAENDEVIIHLVKAVGRVGNAAAVPRLAELLAHRNWVIRSQSALALAALGAVEAAPAIRLLLDDESLAVRVQAMKTLTELADDQNRAREEFAEALA